MPVLKSTEIKVDVDGISRDVVTAAGDSNSTSFSRFSGWRRALPFSRLPVTSGMQVSVAS